MTAQASLMPCGKRLHLHHGPIDLVIGADGDRGAAFAAARDRFATVLQELVAELPDLRAEMLADTSRPDGQIARRMDAATRYLVHDGFITRMAAVAGSVADTILQAMTDAAELTRAYVNNGGDIAVHLAPGQSYATAMASSTGADLGRITIRHGDAIRGIATSGRHGRSHSLGIADSVTVLARTAAQADVAATLIANTVDLPGHAGIRRRPASDLSDDSDLGSLPVVVGCNPLSEAEVAAALARGLDRAQSFVDRKLIAGAALFLQGDSRMTGCRHFSIAQRRVELA